MQIAAIVILIIIILVWLYRQNRYTHYNTVRTTACTNISYLSANPLAKHPAEGASCEKYNVHREHPDREQAAKLMQEIVKRTTKLIDHLRKKYEPAPRALDADHSGRIDIVPQSNLFYEKTPDNTDSADASVIGLDANMREEIQERVEQLIRNFNPKDIHEISPLNGDNLTSYTQDKKTLVLCLRRKNPDSNGDYPLHDINIMMFVVVHELTHMMNDTWGHPIDFWKLFKFMLVNSQECRIYTPVNYRQYPIVYCGLKIDYNPYFDPSK